MATAEKEKAKKDFHDLTVKQVNKINKFLNFADEILEKEIIDCPPQPREGSWAKGEFKNHLWVRVVYMKDGKKYRASFPVPRG